VRRVSTILLPFMPHTRPTPSAPKDSRPSPQQTFVKELFSTERGYPLYLPAPYDHLPQVYKDRGIQIGDVGVLTPGGGFLYFFSIACSAEDPINEERLGVPPAFEPYGPFKRSDSGTKRSNTHDVDIWSGNPLISQVKNLYPTKCAIISEHVFSGNVHMSVAASASVSALICASMSC
jgi:hypothetical protein